MPYEFMVTHPHDIEGRNLWTAASYPDARKWVRQLTSEHIEEIDAAVNDTIARGKRFDEISKEDNFVLPKASKLLCDTFDDLENGGGFAVIGGLPVDRYSYDEALIAYAGLSTHLGVLVDQSYDGAMKVDVANFGLPYNKNVRGYHSNALLPFHTDGACFTGLLCVGEAAEGGESVLVSSSALHNIVYRDRPDLYEILSRGFHHHRRGQHATGESPVSPEPIPVFRFYNGLLQCNYDRNQSLWAREEGIKLDPIQIEAMDYLDALMARPDLQLRMEMRKGDIQYVNNFLVLHSRSEYLDSPAKKRHLIRLWIDVPNGKRAGVTTRDLYVRNTRLKQKSMA
jgi:hypothetical protein